MKFKLTILSLLITLATTAQVQEVICSEYRSGFIKEDGTAWAQGWITGIGAKVVPYNGGHQFVEGKGALYNMVFRKATGEVYLNNPNSQNLQFLQYDTLGIPFKGIAIAARMQTYYAIRQDGTIWMCGGKARWTKLPGQPAVKFKAIDKGAQLVALTEDGTVYTLADGSATWVKKILPGSAQRIFASGNGFYIALVNGQPYGWGQAKFLTGVTGTISTPIALKDHWGIGERKIIDLAANENTIHFILDDNTLWGMGNNAQGEVGNGYELVNKVEYAGQKYIWNWISPTQSSYQQIAFVPKPVHIRPDVKFKRVFGGGTYAFYKYAQDINGNLYSWGRNKAAVLANGRAVSNESLYPNFGDVVTPTLVNPFAYVIPMPYEFVPGKVSAGVDQSLLTISTQLTGSATPSGSKTFSYPIIKWEWRKISGQDCSIITPLSRTPIVGNMQTGAYSFELKVTDSADGTMEDTVVVNVTIVNKPPISEVFCSKVVIDKSMMLKGKASDPDGKITATEWDKLAGPAGDLIFDHGNDVVEILFTSSGEYVYRFSAFDDGGASSAIDVTLIVYKIDAGGFIIMRKN